MDSTWRRWDGREASTVRHEKYFAAQDVAYHFYWHQRTLKLLQWKYKKRHWLLKNPTHMPRIPQVLQTYPDAKFIFTHRDPIASGDSVVNVQGTIYHWRTDDPWGGRVIDEWVLPEPRARLWEQVIGWMEDGTRKKGSFTNFLYHEFMRDPIVAIRRAYADLGLQGSEAAFARMTAFLASRPQGGHGAAHQYDKVGADDPVLAKERGVYQRYQNYFGVPNER